MNSDKSALAAECKRLAIELGYVQRDSRTGTPSIHAATIKLHAAIDQLAALASGPAGAQAAEPEPISEDWWLDLAQRHVNADWNSNKPDGYLHAVKALVTDAAASPQVADAPSAEPRIQWPKARDIGRLEDMGQGHLRVLFDSDNDVIVEVFDGEMSASVEFCNGGGGGGQSSRTRIALIALMVAMEADNAEKPSRDWWALRATQGARHD